MASNDQIVTQKDGSIFYPDSDGKPMAENTKQFNWIVRLVGNLRSLFHDREDVLVVGDLLWYPVEGNPKITTAPDAMVVFGRPKGDRGSYKQWEEDGIPPQVVFEVLSPGNKSSEMMRKQLFYEKHGVQEYCIIDPDELEFFVWIRKGDGFRIWEENGREWTSALLGIKIAYQEDGEIGVFFPDGRPFLLPEELDQQMILAMKQADEAAARANQEAERADQEAERADEAVARANELSQKLAQEQLASESMKAELKRLQALLKEENEDQM